MKQGNVEDIAAKLKKVVYDMETVRRMVENTTEIDRVREDMDAVILRMRNLEIAQEKSSVR
jgi:hypothetical protein